MAPDARSSLLLAERELRDISLNIKGYVPRSEEDTDTRIKLYSLFERCLYSAKQHSLPATHSVAAFNTVCAIIDQCTDSNIESVNKLLFHAAENDPGTTLFWQCFDLYFTQGSYARPKSSKQLLSSLTATLRRFDGEQAVCFAKAQLVRQIERVLLYDEDDGNLKPCLQMLSHLLQKDVLTLDDINIRQLHHEQRTPDQSPTAVVGHGALLELLMRLAVKSDLASTIGQLLTIVLKLSVRCSTALQSPGEAGQPIWAVPLIRVFRNAPENVDKLKRYIFPVLFRHDVSNLAEFLTLLGFDGRSMQSLPHEERDLLYAVLASANEMGLIKLTQKQPVLSSSDFVSIAYRQVDEMLSDDVASARLCGLSLLIASQAITKPFEMSAFKLLRRHLHHIHGDTDADFRGELLGLTARLFDRLRAVTAALTRGNVRERKDDSPDGNGTSIKTLREHFQYIQWYLRFISWELRPSATYQRHICAVRCLNVVVRSGLDDRVEKNKLSKSAQGETKWPSSCHVLHPALAELILDLVMNTFDDVRQAAAACLDVYSSVVSLDAGGENLSNSMDGVLQRSEQLMLASGRADHADGVAHMYALLSARIESSQLHGPRNHYLEALLHKLEMSLKIAASDLPSAVQQHPVHGVLTSIRYTVEGKHVPGEVLQQAALDLIAPLRTVWMLVRPILCNDAPEGYLPEDFGNTPAVTTKDTLSFCWRALKEASLLSGSLITMFFRVSSDDAAKSHIMQALGHLTFAQLSELRHRGAFSTVAQTGTICCIQCRSWADDDSSFMIDNWFEDTLDLLKDEIIINTRRSAGIPSLMCGVLIGSRDRTMFARAMAALETIARNAVDTSFAKEGSLPQVHAINCIKDIIRHSMLADQSERFVPTALTLAADSLRSNAWAIRNCGLMLFRAVIDRLLGTNDSFEADHSSSNRTLNLERHPQLLNIITKLLTTGESSQNQNEAANEAVFLALQLLQRARVPEAGIVDVQVAVLELTASTSWHVRDKAARTYASLVSQADTVSELQFLLSLGTTCHQNALHGLLLCSLYILKSINTPGARKPLVLDGSSHSNGPTDEMRQRCIQLVYEHMELYKQNDCDFTRAAYIDLLTVAMAFRGQLCKPAATNPSCPNFMGDVEGVHGQLDLPAELQEVLHTTNRPTINALTVKLAAAAAQYYNQGNGEATSATSKLVHLARSDPHACKIFLDHFSTAISCECMEILQLCSHLSREDYAISVRTAACKAMTRMVSNTPLEGRIEQYTRFCSKALRDSSMTSVDVHSSAALADAVLELRALYIDLAARLNILNIDEGQVNCWLRWCEQTVREEAIFTREAASRSIAHLSTSAMSAIVKSHSKDTLFLRLCLLIYDMLNDDDEDIRLCASAAACRLISATRHTRTEFDDLTPVLASEALLNLMVTTAQFSGDVAKIAVLRTFGAMNAIGHQLDAAMHIDNVLFAEEKQNLYVDDAREIKAWSQVLLQLQPTLLPKPMLKRLALWTVGGLDDLNARVRTNGGTLRLSSKENVFVLGLQLIYGAEVLLHCSTAGITLPVKPSVLMLGLHQLERSKSNLLWRWEAERVLGSEVTNRLLRIGIAISSYQTIK